MQKKGRRNGRSIIVIIIVLVIVVIVLSVRFFSQYLNDAPEPTNDVNSYVVSEPSIRPPLISDGNDAADVTAANQEEETVQTGGIETVQVGSGLRTNELLDLIIAAMNAPGDYEEYYRRIPASQLDGLALEEFSQYLNLLRRGIGGNVDSYSTMSLEYVRSIREDMQTHGDEAAAYAEVSTFNWLERNSADGETRRFALVLQMDQNGTPYLSRDYILASLDLFAFTRLYYQVVEKGDVAALSELVYTDIDDDAIRREKAERTIAYYDEFVQGSFDDYRIVSVRMDQLVLAQMTAAPSGTARDSEGAAAGQTTQRYVSVVRQGRNFHVYDAVPDPGLSDVRILQDRNVRLILGDIYSQKQLEGYLGDLVAVRAFAMTKPYQQADMLIELVWNDKVLTLLSSDYDTETLQGTGELVAIQNRDPGYSLGDTFRIGMTLEELSEEFLFINVRNYTWIDNEMTLNRLLFEGESDTVAEISQANYTMAQVDASRGEPMPVSTVEEAVELRRIRNSEALLAALESKREQIRELGDTKRDGVERFWDQDGTEISPETIPSDTMEPLIPKETIEDDVVPE